MLDRDRFLQIVAATPLVSIDLIVTNSSDEVLLGQRKNAPAKGFWFVPGGRIMKSESLEQAFKRISMSELGREFRIKDAKLIGLFEHHYPDNVANDEFATHYIATGLHLELQNDELSLPQEQHDAYRWFDQMTLMASQEVHQNTKDYFNKNKGLR